MPFPEKWCSPVSGYLGGGVSDFVDALKADFDQVFIPEAQAIAH
jgi:hypothetical protein